MALTTRDRQQLYTRLAPVIGEEEAETLLDQFPSSTDARFATIADLQAVEARLGHRIDLLEAKMEAGFERLEKLVYRQMRNQTILMMTTIVAVLGLVAKTNIFG